MNALVFIFSDAWIPGRNQGPTQGSERLKIDFTQHPKTTVQKEAARHTENSRERKTRRPSALLPRKERGDWTGIRRPFLRLLNMVLTASPGVGCVWLKIEAGPGRGEPLSVRDCQYLGGPVRNPLVVFENKKKKSLTAWSSCS